MDREFQITTLWQKLDFARSANPTNVCNGITDMKSVLRLLNADSSDLIDPLDTAFEVADVALGFGEIKLEGPYANQVRNLLDDFEKRARNHFRI